MAVVTVMPARPFPAVISPPRGIFLITSIQSLQSFRNLLLFLCNQEFFHRVLFVVVLDQLNQLPLLLELWPSWRFILVLTTSPPPSRVLVLNIPHQPCNIIPFLFIIALLVPHMVDAEHPPQDRRATQIINGKVRTVLILELQERKPATLACLLVPD